jgi:hypothetical protein
MISFFRKIRQKLLSQNQVTRYLVYAFGEIFLVVIGILIALQVNNWNEEKKNDAFEHEILSLLDQNLQKDSILISIELRNAKTGNQLTDSLLTQVEKGNYGEQLNFWMGKIVNFQRFKSQSAAFEVLKSKGLENISDKELQLGLIEYYDQSLFKLYQTNLDVENAFNSDWVPVMKEEIQNFVYNDRIVPHNPKEFFESRATIVLFKMYQDNRAGAIRNMETALGGISKLRTLIKKQQP